MYKNLLKNLSCGSCSIKNICFLRNSNIYIYPEYIQDFIIFMPQGVFEYRNDRWFGKFDLLYRAVIKYYYKTESTLVNNQNNVLTNTAQAQKDEKKIRDDLLKFLLDAAAKATEKTNKEMSIIFDGIGLLYVSDYYEAVNKIMSMMKKGIELEQDYYSSRKAACNLNCR